jgi:hypothetical protein
MVGMIRLLLGIIGVDFEECWDGKVCVQGELELELFRVGSGPLKNILIPDLLDISLQGGIDNHAPLDATFNGEEGG